MGKSTMKAIKKKRDEDSKILMKKQMLDALAKIRETRELNLINNITK